MTPETQPHADTAAAEPPPVADAGELPLPTAPVVTHEALSATQHRIRFSGILTLREAGDIWAYVRETLAHLKRGARVELDLADVEAIDGGTMALLLRHRSDLAAAGVRAVFVNARPNVQALVHLYAGDARAVGRTRRRRPPEGTLAQIGRATLALGAELKATLAVLGELVVESLALVRRPRTGNWREVTPLLERVGANALPIVILINFLVGFVLAYQASLQLKQFGANIFVANLVGKSVTREMGPLMTAIILSGRSGAAFAAELGTMKVSEELDALRTMGFGPMRYLVVPRMVALVLAMPVLVLVGDFAAMLGGLVVAVISLDLTIDGYTNQLAKVITAFDVWSGLLKSVFFALAIAVIACQQGFATTGGAEGVGRRTTASVVAILVALIVIDAAFTMVFHAHK